MFKVEDYILVSRLAQEAIKNLDENLLDELLALRGKIGDEVMNDEIENKKLIAFLDSQLGI